MDIVERLNNDGSVLSQEGAAEITRLRAKLYKVAEAFSDVEEDNERLEKTDGIDYAKVTILPGNKINRVGAAKVLGVKPKTMAEWHRTGIGPDSFTVGNRRYYNWEEIRAIASGEKPIRTEAAK